MHAAGRATDAPADPGPFAGRSEGLCRRLLVGPATGSVHQAVALVELAPGGRVERHVHAFEEAVYVLGGGLELALAGGVETLGADEYAFLDAGLVHGLASAAGARFLEVGAPQPGAAGLEDTVFVDERVAGAAAADGFRRGHFEEGMLPPPSGTILAGFGAANVTGASLHMLVDPAFGASQLNLFVVQYAPGGAIAPHDHPFEEAYVYVAGEIEATLEGHTHTLSAGDWCWSSVGSQHAFANRSGAPVRWIETQVPQPPSRRPARFAPEWEAFLAGGATA